MSFRFWATLITFTVVLAGCSSEKPLFASGHESDREGPELHQGDTCSLNPSQDAGGAAPPELVVNLEECPPERGNPAPLLPHLPAGGIDGETIITVIVHLKAIAAAPLTERYLQNQQQAHCVLTAFGEDGVRPLARWYEEVEVDSAGRPRPIGRAFSARVRWKSALEIAEHPYVESVSYEFGQGAYLGVLPELSSFDCVPPANTPDLSKVTFSEFTSSTERFPVVLELNLGHLPPEGKCEGEPPCDDSTRGAWERTIIGTRTATCVRDWLGTQLKGIPEQVAYAATEAWPTTPALPPFAQLPAVVSAFAVTLGWEEVLATSRHPFVRQIWTSTSLEVEQLPPGCPEAHVNPPPKQTCNSERESSETKLSPTDVKAWSAEPGASFDVLIAIQKNFQICPKPACPGARTSCPERDAYNKWLVEASLLSQECVKGFIEGLGGQVTEQFTLGNGMAATLTWEQIAAVASHPDVISIVPSTSTTPHP